jgi:hypothetical protein
MPSRDVWWSRWCKCINISERRILPYYASGQCRVVTFVGGFLRSGSLQDAFLSQGIVHTVIRAVMGFEGLTVKKNIFTQQTAEIRWILLNCVDGTIRPINTALVKVFFLCSVLISRSQRLLTAPSVNLYPLFFTRDFIARILGPFLFFKSNVLSYNATTNTVSHKART